MTQYGFYFDSSRCTGCKTCDLACKDYNDLGSSVTFRRVYDVEGGTWNAGTDGTWTSTAMVYHVSNACNHCDNPACAAACPQDAYVKEEATGFVHNDPSKCIGCGTCVEACPYGAPRLGDGNVAVKCHGCEARVEEGNAPVCVEACPLRCLEFGEIGQLRAKYGNSADIASLPDSSVTSPNLVVKSNDAAESAEAPSAWVANELEVA